MSDDRKFHDRHHPGISSRQRAQADDLLGNLKVPPHLEKRDIKADYLKATLQHRRMQQEVPVLISRDPYEGRAYHIVLSAETLPEVRDAEIVIPRLQDQKLLIGRIEFLKQGSRKEDQLDSSQMLVSRFFPFT